MPEGRGITAFFVMKNKRFIDNDSGAIRDIKTNLVWLKDAGILGMRTWEDAVEIVSGIQAGKYGLADGSVEGDWRLPSIQELSSLFDYKQWNPALPEGYPFIKVRCDWYWSSTTCIFNTDDAWVASMSFGSIFNDSKPSSWYIWPVRSGYRT